EGLHAAGATFVPAKVHPAVQLTMPPSGRERQLGGPAPQIAAVRAVSAPGGARGPNRPAQHGRAARIKSCPRSGDRLVGRCEHTPMPDDAKIPTGRWGRLTKLARAGAHTGIALVRSKAAEASVERVAQLLGEMRGIASKVGQMASYVDGLVPEEQRELFEKSLSHLRTAAPRSSATEIRRIVEEELRAPIDRVFAAW